MSCFKVSISHKMYKINVEIIHDVHKKKERCCEDSFKTDLTSERNVVSKNKSVNNFMPQE